MVTFNGLVVSVSGGIIITSGAFDFRLLLALSCAPSVEELAGNELPNTVSNFTSLDITPPDDKVTLPVDGDTDEIHYRVNVANNHNNLDHSNDPNIAHVDMFRPTN